LIALQIANDNAYLDNKTSFNDEDKEKLTHLYDARVGLDGMTTLNTFNPINVVVGVGGGNVTDFGTIANGANISELKLTKHRALFNQARTNNA